MKTPEELEIEYGVKIAEAFLAGYEAAKDQLGDASKVMPQWNRMYDKDGLTGEKYWPPDGSLVVCANAERKLVIDFKCHACDKIMYWIELPPIPNYKDDK